MSPYSLQERAGSLSLQQRDGLHVRIRLKPRVSLSPVDYRDRQAEAGSSATVTFPCDVHAKQPTPAATWWTDIDTMLESAGVGVSARSGLRVPNQATRRGSAPDSP